MPSPLEQLSLIYNSHRKNVVVGRESFREITHMQVGQCGSQEARAEFFLPQAQGGPRNHCEG